MGQWLPNLNSKQRKNSKRPARIPNPAPKQEAVKKAVAQPGSYSNPLGVVVIPGEVR